MYLLVFVTLVIGLIGIYGQILTTQTARVAATQTGFVQTMMDWHSAAVSMGGSVMKGAAAPAAAGESCSLTAYNPTGVSVCLNTLCGGNGVVVDKTGTLKNKIALDKTGVCTEDVHLADNYQAKYYQFYSALYVTTSGARYIITWIQPPAMNPAPGYIALPSGYQTSLTMSDVVQQFRNIAKSSPYIYGTVKAGMLDVGGLKTDVNTLNISYDVPSCVKDGSIAVISSADGL